MNSNAKKLAAAALAAATASPMAASALPVVTTIQQASNSVEATFANTFAQSVSSDVAFGATGLAVDTEGAGAAIDGTFTLSATLPAVNVGTPAVTLGSIDVPKAIAGGTAASGGILQITAVVPVAGATALSISNTVFAVESIKATQSVIDSTSTTAF